MNWKADKRKWMESVVDEAEEAAKAQHIHVQRQGMRHNLWWDTALPGQLKEKEEEEDTRLPGGAQLKK